MRDIEKVDTMAKGLSPRIPPKSVGQGEKEPTKSNGKAQPQHRKKTKEEESYPSQVETVLPENRSKQLGQGPLTGQVRPRPRNAHSIWQDGNHWEPTRRVSVECWGQKLEWYEPKNKYKT